MGLYMSVFHCCLSQVLLSWSSKLEGQFISRLGLGCKIEFNILLERRVGFILRFEICWQSVPCNTIGLLPIFLTAAVYCLVLMKFEGMLLLFMGRFTMRSRLVGFGIGLEENIPRNF